MPKKKGTTDVKAQAKSGGKDSETPEAEKPVTEETPAVNPDHATQVNLAEMPEFAPEPPAPVDPAMVAAVATAVVEALKATGVIGGPPVPEPQRNASGSGDGHGVKPAILVERKDGRLVEVKPEREGAIAVVDGKDMSHLSRQGTGAASATQRELMNKSNSADDALADGAYTGRPPLAEEPKETREIEGEMGKTVKLELN